MKNEREERGVVGEYSGLGAFTTNVMHLSRPVGEDDALHDAVLVSGANRVGDPWAVSVERLWTCRRPAALRT